VVDWSAQLRRAPAVRIVSIRPVADSPAELPNYRRPNWRPVNGVQFAELDSYDIRGVSEMITRSIRYETIRYILGATREGRRLLRDYPNTPLSWINYFFIDDDATVRAWLLSNPVLDDPLDISKKVTVRQMHCRCVRIPGGLTWHP